MSAFTGTAALARLALRLDRIRIPVWIVAIVGLVLVVASGIKEAYPTAADLERAAAILGGNGSQIALNGPAQSLDTLGGRVAFEVWNVGLVAVALMSLLMIGRHTRAEEESGRTELVRATVVGRHASTTAALLIVVGMNLLVGIGVALVLTLFDLPLLGSLTMGAAFPAVGVVFAGIATLAAQVTGNTRVVYGIGGAALGLAFVLRAIGDVGEGTLSLLSPLGWVQASRPFAGERWWPLLEAIAFTVALVFAASALAARRDVGAGLVQPRPGRAHASRSLRSPIGLALRLQRGTLIGWSVGLFLGGLALGSVGGSVDDLVGDNPNVRDVLVQVGDATVTDSFFATFALMLALIAAGFAIGSAQRLRVEEAALRAEPVLATSVSRERWAGSHLLIALTGTVAVLAAAGLGTGLAYGVVGDLAEAPRLLGATLVYAPAVWVLVGITAASFGIVPRWVPTAWLGLVVSLMVGLLGQMLELPDWFADISPFQHVPRLPAADLTIIPVGILAFVAAGLVAIGLIAFRQRDVG